MTTPNHDQAEFERRFVEPMVHFPLEDGGTIALSPGHASILGNALADFAAPEFDLELVDADGDRIAFRLNRTDPRDEHPVEVWLGGHDPQPAWALEAALTRGQARQLAQWLVDLDDCVVARAEGPERRVVLDWGDAGPRPVLVSGTVLQGLADELNAVRAQRSGQPYTDEELARTPSARRDAILTRALDGDAVVTHVERQPTPPTVGVWLEGMADGSYAVWDRSGPGIALVGHITAEQYALVEAGR